MKGRKRITGLLCLALCLALAATAAADLKIIDKGTAGIIYGSVEDTGGYIVEVVPPEATTSEKIQ